MFITTTGSPELVTRLIGTTSTAGSGMVTTIAAGPCAAASVISFACAFGSVVSGEL